jgi:regulatory protein
MTREQQPRDRSRTQRPLDEALLRALALSSVGRYATTQAKLSAYLRRKVRDRGWSPDGAPPIDRLVSEFAGLRYVDDDQFAETRAGALFRRGLGPRRVRAALHQAGIDSVTADVRSALAPEEAMATARAFARRKRLGPFGPPDPDLRMRQRAFAAMIRAGHSVPVARLILDEEIPEMNHDGG